MGSRTYRDENRQLQYLYTIARNLCSQHYRDKTITYSLDEEVDFQETYIKLAAGFTWIMTAALIVFLSVMIPYFSIYGIEGTGEMLQLVKPMSMLPCTIGHMLAVYFGIYLLAAVLFAAVTMLLSVITQNQLAAICGLMGYLLIDLFVEFPDRYSLLQKIWLLRPNAILMNSGFSNYRLIHLAGRLFLNYQAASVLYAIIVMAALLIGQWKYKRLQVGN